MDNWICSLKESLCRYIGQTVTVFTNSGGYSGAGFTGVLISISDCVVRILISAGDTPSCPLGSNCSRNITPYYNYDYYRNPFGSIAIIPINSIAAFTHNSI